MTQIIQIKDNVGGEEVILHPQTTSEAVLVGDKKLTQVLGEISSKSSLIEVAEDGFYYIDSDGNIIAKYDEEGSHFVFSQQVESDIKVIIDNSDKNKLIDGTKIEQVNTYKRVTDNGITTSNVYLSVIEAGDIAIGEKTIKIRANNYLFSDFFKFSSNAPIRLKNKVIDGKNITITIESNIAVNDVTLFIEYSLMSEEHYDVINYRIKTAVDATTIQPTFPLIKFNKRIPLVYITDDMGAGDFYNIWAAFNGYPVGTSDASQPDAEGILNGYWGNASMPIHTPFSYTDDIGGLRRYGFSCAVWPDGYASTLYTKFNAIHAKLMSRFGVSFTFHDLDPTTMQSIRDGVTKWSSFWGKEVNNNNLKIMTEPNGQKIYIKAVQKCPEICLALSQNEGRFVYYIDDNGNEVFKLWSEATEAEKLIGEDVNILGYNKSLSSWKSGRDYTSFKRKPNGSLVRYFIPSNYPTQSFIDQVVNNPDGTVLVFGNHGMADTTRAAFQELATTKDDIWVCSVDEFWEYYHLANNTIIEKPVRDGDYITFNVYIPKYYGNQFREINLNIPVTDCTECIITGNVITGGWRQNAAYLSIISGLEEKHYSYISDTIKLVKKYPTNTNIRNDAQYLIDMLVDGSVKTSFQSNLDLIAIE